MDEKPLVSFDFAIKYLLKNKGEFQIVEGFISALLKAFGYSAVKIKALLESESNKEQDQLKRSIADLVVEDQEANKYIVEIDRAYTSTFLYKACFKLHCKALQVLLGVAPQVRVCLSVLYFPCVLLCLALAYASNGEDSFCGSIAVPEAYLACPPLLL